MNDNPTTHYRYAGYTITEEEIREIFKKYPWCLKIIMPDSTEIERPE